MYYNAWVYYSFIPLILLVGIFMRAMQLEYSIVDFYDKNYKRNRIVSTATFVMIGYIVFWAAIRNGVVDTNEYIRQYGYLNTDLTLKQIFTDDEEKAPLFLLYKVILKKLGISWHVYIGSIAVFSGFCIYKGISNYSDDVPLSCYIFVTSVEFYWLFNGIRQFIAVSIFFAFMRLIPEKKLVKFLLLVFFLYLIHKTAIILIPIYFIANFKNWGKGIFSCVVATIIIVVLFPNLIVEWLDSAFTEYNVSEQFALDDGVNPLRLLVSLVTPTIAFIYRKRIKEIDNLYINFMVNTSLITAGLYAVGVVTSGIFMGRLPLYTESFNILLLPFLIKRVVDEKYKSLVYVACIAGFFLYFHLQVQNGMGYTTDLFDSMNYGMW